jgi:hypothetical protein
VENTVDLAYIKKISESYYELFNVNKLKYLREYENSSKKIYQN